MNETQYIKRPGERAAWLAARRGYVGGSEVAAICGLSPWKTPVDVFLDKTGRTADDEEAEDLDATLPLRLGNVLEQFAADEYTLRTGRETRNFGYMVTRGHALADVDRLVVPDGEKVASHHAEIRTSLLLEIKTTAHGEKFADGVPDNYEAQVQQYLELTGAEKCDVAVLILAPRAAFKVFPVYRDREVGAALVARIEKFWRECVETDTPPPAVNLDDARALFPNARPESRMEATPELLGLLRDLREAETMRKALEDRADALKGKIAAAMGDAEALVDGKVKLCTFKAPKPTEKIDYKAALVQTAEEFHIDPVRVGQIVHAHGTIVNPARRFLLCAEK